MMKNNITRILWVAAVISMLLLARPASAQAASDDALQIWQVGVDDLSVYPAPDSQLPAFGALDKNEICLVIDTMTDTGGILWGRIDDEQSGWIQLSKCVYRADTVSGSAGEAAKPVYGAMRIAHRGSHTDGCKDNTVEAFEKAGQEGFWGIEADLRANTDTKTLVIHHDSAAEATCTFSEYLDICNAYGCRAVIDIKYMNDYETYLTEAVDMVKEKGMLDQAIFQCSICDYLAYIHSYCADAHLWILSGKSSATDETTGVTYPTRTVNKVTMELIEAVRAVGAEGVNMDLSYDYTAEYAEKLHVAGIQVCTNLYTSSETYEKYKDLYSDYRMANVPNP